MNLIPLRTAAIAGSAAIALSFVAVPAFASNGHSDDSSDSVAVTNDQPSTGTSADAPSDDATTTGSDDGTEVGDDNGTDVNDDEGDDASDDGSDDSDAPAPAATEAPLPAEQGKPVEVVSSTVLEPSAFARKGVKVTISGLTKHAEYQPFYATAQAGDSIGEPRKANGDGRITFVWKPSKARTFLGTYDVGVVGIDTDLKLTQSVEVKYDSDLAWKPATRHGKKVTLSVVADHAKASGRSDSPWKKVVVDFQKKVGSKWVTVKKDRTDAKGLASVTVASGTQSWRAVVESSDEVAGTKTRGHRK